MKDRLPALDGLRGFAAISVVLGHASIWNYAINSPFQIILIAISAAHNAVQILFVLSGFLMAYLYPVIPSPFEYIKKRYGRIIPIYATVVIFIWIRAYITTWYLQIPLLLSLALILHLTWKMLRKQHFIKQIGIKIFVGFIIFQISILLFNLIYTRHHIEGIMVNLPRSQYDLIVMLSNLTFTSQLIKGIPPLSGVFWSLGTELLFYIVYPFIVVPIITVARKRGLIISVLLIIAIIKILLDLDNTFSSIAGLNGLNIARASGFVAGTTIGAIYQSKGYIWNKISPVIHHPLFGFVGIAILILAQLGEHIVGLGSIEFMNIFYLITSWLIAITVLSTLSPNSISHKIFSKKLLVFLGLVSYSLYLIHSEVAHIRHEVEKTLLQISIFQKFSEPITFIIYLVLSIFIAFLLFRLVESLYFSSKKSTIATTQAAYSEKVATSSRKYIIKTHYLISLIIFILVSAAYSGMYSPKLLVSRHQFNTATNNNEITLTQRDTLLSFTSSHNNLSVIGFDMRYLGSAGLTKVNSSHPSALIFKLFNNQNKEIFRSTINSYEVEGSPRFQFGFPTIQNSKNRKYFVQLSVQGGKNSDSVAVKVSPTSFISISTIQPSTLSSIGIILFNRVIFLLTNPDYLFLLGTLLVVLFLSRKEVSGKLPKLPYLLSKLSGH